MPSSRLREKCFELRLERSLRRETLRGSSRVPLLHPFGFRVCNDFPKHLPGAGGDHREVKLAYFPVYRRREGVDAYGVPRLEVGLPRLQEVAVQESRALLHKLHVRRGSSSRDLEEVARNVFAVETIRCVLGPADGDLWQPKNRAIWGSHVHIHLSNRRFTSCRLDE